MDAKFKYNSFKRGAYKLFGGKLYGGTKNADFYADFKTVKKIANKFAPKS